MKFHFSSNYLKSVVITIAAFLCLTTACKIPEPVVTTGSISGIIYCDGSPISGVNVEISPGGSSYISKEDGSYSFLDLNAGQYTLKFTKKGYLVQSKTLTVNAGAETRGDVMIEIDPNSFSISTKNISFGSTLKSQPLSLTNNSPINISWGASLSDSPRWLSISSDSGTLAPNGTVDLILTVDRSKVEGEQASSVLTIKTSTNQTLSVQVDVTAGKPATATIKVTRSTGTTVDFDVFVSKNTKYFYLAFSLDPCTVDELLTIGDYAVVKDGEYQYKYTASGREPNTTYYMYVLPFNEFDQQGELYKSSITTPKEDGPKPTVSISLDNVTDHSFEMTANFSDNATDFYFWLSETNRITEDDILRDGDFIHLSQSTYSELFSTPDWAIKPNSYYYCYIIPVSNTGRLGDLVIQSVKTKETEQKPTADILFSNITSNSFDVKLTFSDNTSSFYFMASLNGTYTKEQIINSSNTGPYSHNGDQTLNYNTEEDGVAPNTTYYFYLVPISTNGTIGDLVKKSVTTKPEKKASLEDYAGFWDLEGKDWLYDNEDVFFERVEFYPYTFPGDDYESMIVFGLINGYEFFYAIGEFDKNRETLNLLGGLYMSGEKWTYHYTNDPDVDYYAIFKPVYYNGTDAPKFVNPAQGYNNSILSLKLNNGEIITVNGPKADNNGRYANGYTFEERNCSDDSVSAINLNVIHSIRMTRSSDQSSSLSTKNLRDRVIKAAQDQRDMMNKSKSLEKNSNLNIRNAKKTK